MFFFEIKDNINKKRLLYNLFLLTESKKLY